MSDNPLSDNPVSGNPAGGNEVPAGAESPAPEQPSGALERALQSLTSGTLADGEWHHLHPATPLLRGGIILIAVLGYLIANLRGRLISIFVPEQRQTTEGDPIDWVLTEHLVGWVILGIAVVILIVVALFYLSWRMHTFRVTHEAVEVRSGMLFRKHRRAALDRIQGININRPLIPRMLGACKLQVSVAGQGASVELTYLGSARTDDLRRDILRLASGVKEAGDRTDAAAAPAPNDASAPGPDSSAQHPSATSAFVNARLDDFARPDQDLERDEPTSVVRIPIGRIVGAVVISWTTVFLLLFVVGMVFAAVYGSPYVLFSFIPMLFGFLAFYKNRITRSLQYSIAATPHGVRVGFGLLSTSNETIPPGRIHGITVRQSLLWRPFGWWEIWINTAVQQSGGSGDGTQQSSVLMPVGTRDDVQNVLRLLLPGMNEDEANDLVERGLFGSGPDGDFVTAPRSSWIFNPFTWRRVGYALLGDELVTRAGKVHRKMNLVPLARVQSVRVGQGPWQRRRGLASTYAHTVTGPVTARVSQLGRDDALRFFTVVTDAALAAAEADTTERWAAVAE